MTRRRKLTLIFATTLTAAGAAWFVHGPLADVACAGADGSLDHPSSVERFACERACSRGSARACVYRDDMLFVRTVRSDPRGARAARWQRACEGGDACACGRVGVVWGDLGDFEASVRDLRRGCAGDCARACALLANHLADPKEQEDVLQRACDLGDGDGCVGLGAATSGARSLAAYDRACELGPSGYGCFAARDIAREGARGYVTKACRTSPGACVELGEEIERAREPLTPDAIAVMRPWCTRAGAYESQPCSCLARLAMEGRAPSLDGMGLLRASCANGGDASCLELARFAHDDATIAKICAPGSAPYLRHVCEASACTPFPTE